MSTLLATASPVGSPPLQDLLDISQPNNIKEVGYFDTYPQGGYNTGFYGGGAYAGNWGAYPFFPSGRIAAQDMQNGIYILDPSPAYTSTVSMPVGTVGLNSLSNPESQLFPNPASNELHIASSQAIAEIIIYDINGRTVSKINCREANTFDLSLLTSGLYWITWSDASQRYNQLLQIKK
mgnify:CR=1 FL=1